MEVTEIAAYAGMTAAALAIIGLAVRAIYSMASLAKEVQALKETVGIELQAHKEAQSLELQAHRETQNLEMRSLRETVGHELRALEQRINQNHEVLRSDIQRLFDAMATHTHDTDGAVIFRIPATPQPESEEASAD